MDRAAARARRRATGLTEAGLAAAWESRAFDPGELVDDSGRRIQVVYPGRLWGGAGPDFRGALLALEDGTLLRGDVELHQRASGWRAHRHAADPAYAGVVLHVVGWRDTETKGWGGRPIPTVELRAAARPVRFPSPRPCLHDAGEIERTVEEAGTRRFRDRAARFEGDCAAVGADQALWRAVTETMGYSGNARAFARLADLVPWVEARRVVLAGGVTALEELLAATAGLNGESVPGGMRPSDWRLDGLRPANHPLRRCGGLARLALSWARYREGPAALAEAFAREAHGARHPRLWRWAAAPPLIGRGRAAVVAVNVLLPLVAGVGLRREAEDLYRRAPAEPANRPTLHMARQLGVRGLRFNTACRQQGLLQLFKEHCAGRWCVRCPAAEQPLGALSIIA